MNLRAVIVVALGVVTTIVLLAIVPKGAADEAVPSVAAGGSVTTTLIPSGVTTTTPSSTTTTTPTPTTTSKSGKGKGKGTTTTTTPFVATGRSTVKLGSTGDDVTALQQRLNALGYNAGAANGTFGAQTQTAVENFQKAKNLAADGVVGPTTWNALAAG
jgi:peptidoglycan hydrolase-like protein with peptidoglycan-binding domain